MKANSLISFLLLTSNAFGQNMALLNTTGKTVHDSSYSLIIKDSVETIVSSSLKDSSTFVSFNDSSAIILKENIQSLKRVYKIRGFNELGWKNDFLFSFTSCGILNVFGLIPSLFSISIPNQKQINCKKELKKEKSAVSKAEVKNYRKGMKDKRYLSSFLGATAGIGLNILVILKGIRLV